MDLLNALKDNKQNSPKNQQLTLSQSNNKNRESNSSQSDAKGNQMHKILSSILDYHVGQQNRLQDPEIIRVKNNLLLILLVLSAYGVYYLIGDFLDVLLIAYIAGIAYYQSQEHFTQYVTNPSTYQGPSQPLSKRLIKVVIWFIIGFIFPKLRYMLKNPNKIRGFPSFKSFVKSFSKTNSIVVLVCEILIAGYILKLLLGPYLKRILAKLRPTNYNRMRFFFSIMMVILITGLVILIPTILFRQVTNAGNIIQQKVQQKLGCAILSNQEKEDLPLCSQKISTENQFIRSTIVEFTEQNKTLQQCLIFLEKMQQEYIQKYIDEITFLNQNIYYYDEVICTWYSFISKAVSYSGIKIEGGGQIGNYFSTGKNIFQLFFRNLTWILAKLSDSIFNITTFFTAFVLTVKYYGKSNTIRQIFSQNKQQLIDSITNLIQATFFIVINHFIMSLILLQVFGITPINLILSTLLASMAMFPFIRPWLGVLIIILIRILITQEYYISILFVAIYYLMSQKIYSVHYRKMQLHQIVTNMSVLFGIYRFGVVGIIYGPLIIIIYRCVQRELFRSYITK